MPHDASQESRTPKLSSDEARLIIKAIEEVEKEEAAEMEKQQTK